MSIDFSSYLESRTAPQPDVVTAALGQLLATLHEAQDATAWDVVLDAYLQDVRCWIATGVVDGINAAAALFVGHALQAGYKARGRKGGMRIMAFVSQLAMSPSQWNEALKAMAADGRQAGTSSNVLRLDRFAQALVTSLLSRGDADILRELYLGARPAIDTAARQAMTDAVDFDTWTTALAVLAAYLLMRKALPVTIKADGAEEGRIEYYRDGESDMTRGRFIPPQQNENTMLAHFLARDQIDALLRKEAYAAECFAHLYAAVNCGYVSPQYQQQVADEYTRRSAASRLDARQWLALGKSRFEIASYIR